MTGEPIHLLLVEDNPDHAELVIDSLAGHRIGNHIHHVADGEAALDYLHHRGDYADPETHPRPHVILLDLRLPKIDGLEVLRRIKTNPDLKAIPVVILTTSAAERDVAKAYQHRANSYLVKPVEFGDFVDLMTHLGFYWLCWNRTP